MNNWATAVKEIFSERGISLETITLEMRREYELYPLNVEPLLRHYKVTNEGTLKCVTALSQEA